VTAESPLLAYGSGLRRAVRPGGSCRHAAGQVLYGDGPDLLGERRGTSPQGQEYSTSACLTETGP
jgi:hypothetical protein